MPLDIEEIRFLMEPVSKEGKYAMGLGVHTRGWAGGTVYTHTGSNTMFYSVIWVAPEIDFAVVAACNSAHPDAFKSLDAPVAASLPGR